MAAAFIFISALLKTRVFAFICFICFILFAFLANLDILYQYKML